MFHVPCINQTYNFFKITNALECKGKPVPLQAWTGPESYRNLRFSDFVTMAQDGGRLSAYAPAAFTPRKYSWYSFLFEAESTPGP